MDEEEQEVTEIKDTIVQMLVHKNHLYIATRHSVYKEHCLGRFVKTNFLATTEEETDL